ncbi:MetQ/NlpA family ABC transporter substrate-binding protein [Yinghuangia seranimata]|uniref:MetQ/NlpA family ABC transporter substrate-binding protein n=1 Tax=Yinghuangia seranimata TaxID=408067 RepID=UPI00248CC1D1|nr:MetQ/NlpA family ABC transporter substrate-binding protein [Yinghuangia seranimata]MDI2126697.1 MetQ/NlpA family ABC transporter substrate-binding protein [Yinghuangia seranimata]
MRKIISLAAVGTLALGLAACSSDSGDDKKSDTLKVGASAVPHAEILDYINKNLASKEGLKLDVKVFDDYSLQNPALDDGSITANFFQHQPYLDKYNQEKGKDLVGVTRVHLEPLGVYSHKVKALADIKDGATVAIPNDGTNAGRALKLLADNGVIKLKDGVGVLAKESDVTDNPKHLKFKAQDAELLPRTLDDVDAAVINGNYALQAKLTVKDALVAEKAEGNPYANILVVKKGHENDENVLKLKKLLNSPEVKKFIEDKYQGSVIPAF